MTTKRFEKTVYIYKGYMFCTLITGEEVTKGTKLRVRVGK